MAHPQKQKQARDLFVHQGKTIGEIAAQLVVSEPTVRRWKVDAKTKNDDWDLAKSSSLLAGQGIEGLNAQILSKFARTFTVVMNAMETTIEKAERGEIVLTVEQATQITDNIAKLTDAYAKMCAGVTKTSPKLSKFAVAMDVLTRLNEFVRANSLGDPTMLKRFTDLLEPFSATLAEAYA